MNRFRVLLADDHDTILADVRALLDPEFDVVASVRDGNSLLLAAESLKPDIIVADISMPHMSGIEAAWKIIEGNPDSRIVFLTMHNDPALLKESLAIGAMGYVLKRTAGDELVFAIHEVLEGRRYVSPFMRREL
jgi:DNA-binding NarL/FixJ family response regulator